MNNNGFFTAIIATIIVVLLATMLTVQSIAVKTKQAETSQRTVFELKTQMQNTQQLLDKAASDAMSDCWNRISCTVLDECKDIVGQKNYSTKIADYFNTVIETVKTNNGIDCSVENLPATIDNDNAVFGFELSCAKTFSNGFKAESKRTISLDKTITANMVPQIPPLPDYCTLQVKDNQSGTCDLLVNATTCT